MNIVFIGWKLWKPFSRWVFLLKNWESFCVLQEEGGYHFTTSSHAFQLIPLIRKGEEETKSEISTFNVAVIFNGTTRLGNSAQVCYSWLENQRSPSLASVTSEVTLNKQEEFYQRDHDSTCSVQCHNLQPSCCDPVQCIIILVNAAAIRTVRIIVPKVIMLFFPHYWPSWTALQGIRHQGGGSGGGGTPNNAAVWRSPTVLPVVQCRLQVTDDRAATLPHIEEMPDPMVKASLQIELAADWVGSSFGHRHSNGAINVYPRRWHTYMAMLRATICG